MDGTTFIKHFRQETMDEAVPPLWSDDLILRYLNEAQREFCRRTEGIEDQITKVVPAGAAALSIPDTVLKIRAASLPEQGRMLDLMSVEEARFQGVVLGSRAPSIPRFLVLGTSPGKASVVPAPVLDVTVVLDVMRMPKTQIESPGDETEVNDRHATTLMHYALFRAYSRPDPDSMDRVKADYFRQAFEAECLVAKREQGRARKPNGTTVYSW